jgi:hypothetical protein
LRRYLLSLDDAGRVVPSGRFLGYTPALERNGQFPQLVI